MVPSFPSISGSGRGDVLRVEGAAALVPYQLVARQG